MTLYPFTPKGVEEKLESLYNLENELLLMEADSIELDFVGWMEANFNLNPPQKAYLNGIKHEAINYYGSQGGYYIDLSKPDSRLR